METGTETFNLHKTIEAIGQAMQAILCHMLFDFALHGLLMAIVLVTLSIYLLKRKHAYAVSVRRVAKRITIFCLLLAIPGGLSLVLRHSLPAAGVFNFNSIRPTLFLEPDLHTFSR